MRTSRFEGARLQRLLKKDSNKQTRHFAQRRFNNLRVTFESRNARNYYFGSFFSSLFSRAITCAWRSWALAPEGTRTSSQPRSPSVAKATVMTAAYGTAEEAAEKRLKQVNSAFCATTIQ